MHAKFAQTIIIRIVALALPVTANAATHHYLVSVDPSLEEISVEATLAPGYRSLRVRSYDARRFLKTAEQCDDNRRVRADGRRIRLTANNNCVRYRVDLKRAAASDRRNAYLLDSNRIASPATWLWRPLLRANDRVRVTFALPPDVQVSVPWIPVAGKQNTYDILPSPQSSTAPAVFGDFDYSERELPGATLRVALLKSRNDYDSTALVDWVSATARHINYAYSPFPNPFPQVVIIPTAGYRSGDSAVSFGRVIRDGGETIEFFVDERFAAADFYGDWMATHEFSHLMLPYLRSQHRWISEGFAQYYQNVLLARDGHYSETEAWEKLLAGFERGRESGRGLSPNEAARNRNGALMRFYWSGAAIALLADTELRERSGGRDSLDTVLKQLQQCCLPADRAWSGTELFRRLDGFLDEPLFMPLYRRHADSRRFPDVSAALRRLGVTLVNGDVQLDPHAPLAVARNAMMKSPTQTAAAPLLAP